MLLPLILTLPLLALLVVDFCAVWPPLREGGWKGVVTLSVLTALVSLPSIVAAVDVAFE